MNLNKAFILGNLTRDPELRQTPTGQNVANFGIATNRMWTDPAGNKQTQTEVFIEGRISTRSWQDQQGQKKYRTEIVAENMQLGPRFQSASNQNQAATAASRENDPASNSDRETLPEIQLDDMPKNDEEIKVENIPF